MSIHSNIIFSLNGLIAALEDKRKDVIKNGMDPDIFPVFTVGPIGVYRTINAIVIENDGVFLNTRPMK